MKKIVIENCIKIALDTSVIDPESIILQKLQEYVKQGIVKLFVDDYSLIETEEWKNQEKRIKREEWIFRFCEEYPGAFLIPDGMNMRTAIEQARGFSFNEEYNMEQTIRRIHSPETKGLLSYVSKKAGLRKWTDYQILLNHIMHKQDFFLTKNTNDFIKYDKGKKFESLGIKIREPNKVFLDELELELEKRGLLVKNSLII